MHNLRISMKWKTLTHELKALDAIKKLKAIIDMNDSESWAKPSQSYWQLKSMDP